MANRYSTLTSSKTAILNSRQIAFSENSLLVQGYRLLQMIRNNIFIHFAKPRGLIFTQMHCKKVGGVSFFFSRHTQALFKHYKRIFGKIETILQR